MNNPSLVILAAGMGSRYGGLKQIDTVGNNGESIIDFSIYDAIEAGFKKVYLIIRKEHESAFKTALTDKLIHFIDVEFIYQDMSDLPGGYVMPEGRVKPWGTTHALWACRHHVKEPFLICNADDYYGKDALKTMFQFLSHEVSDTTYGMVGYRLDKTLSDSGSVSRGVCQVDQGILSGVTEWRRIKREAGGIKCSQDEIAWEELSPEALVSMNFWGFTPKIFELAEERLVKFLEEKLDGDPLKCEHVIPTLIGETLHDGLYEVKVMASENAWFGVTYQEDKPYVVEQFARFKAEGLYPFDLWAK
jgi:NDP-sugar pyrophosphorylase family protein